MSADIDHVKVARALDDATDRLRKDLRAEGAAAERERIRALAALMAGSELPAKIRDGILELAQKDSRQRKADDLAIASIGWTTAFRELIRRLDSEPAAPAEREPFPEWDCIEAQRDRELAEPAAGKEEG